MVEGVVRRHLGPLWRTTFLEPVREGRLRLLGLGRLDRQLARAGLVAIALLLVSCLAAAAWRRGSMTSVPVGGGTAFVPDGIIAVTLLCFALAWTLLVQGAFGGSRSVRLVVAAGYLLINSTLAYDAAVGLGGGKEDSLILRHGSTLVHVSFYVAPAALVLSAALGQWRPVARRVDPVLRAVAVAGLAGIFLGLIWMHLQMLRETGVSTMPIALTNTVTEVGAALLPLVYVSAVSVADFGLDVSSSLAEPVRDWPVRWLRLVLVALIAVKLWFEVGAQRDYWRVFVVAQPAALMRSVLVVVMLATLVVIVTRFRRSADTEAAEESLTYGGAAVVAAPYLVTTCWAGLGVLVASELDSSSVADSVPTTQWFSTWGLVIIGTLAVLVGAWLMRRSEGGLGDELGSGLIVVGAWNAVNIGLANSGLQLGISFPVMNLTVTLVVLAIAALGWRRLDALRATTLVTVVLFCWLVGSQGDYLSYLGSLLGLSAVVVLVFGIVWTIASGSAFASASSRRLPQGSRALLYVGYLLLSAAILNWQQTSHDNDSTNDIATGFYFLAIPIAAWLLGRRVLTRTDPGPGPEPSAESGPEPGPQSAIGSEAARSEP